MTEILHVGQRVRVKSENRTGTVTGKAGDWNREDERDWYTVEVHGKRGKNVFHENDLEANGEEET